MRQPSAMWRACRGLTLGEDDQREKWRCDFAAEKQHSFLLKGSFLRGAARPAHLLEAWSCLM